MCSWFAHDLTVQLFPASPGLTIFQMPTAQMAPKKLAMAQQFYFDTVT
jgi:hypothetical protein